MFLYGVDVGGTRDLAVSLRDWESVHLLGIVEESSDMTFGISMKPQDVISCQCDWLSLLPDTAIEKCKSSSKSNKKTIEKQAKEISDRQGVLMIAVCIVFEWYFCFLCIRL